MPSKLNSITESDLFAEQEKFTGQGNIQGLSDSVRQRNVIQRQRIFKSDVRDWYFLSQWDSDPFLSDNQAGENINLAKNQIDFTFKKVESGRLQIGKSHKFLDAAQSLDMLEMELLN